MAPTPTSANWLDDHFRYCLARTAARGFTARVRHDKLDTHGKLTLRHNSRLHPIGLGRRYAGTSMLVLVHDLHIRVLSTSG